MKTTTDDCRLDSDVAIVTGASRGIGRAVATTLAGAGAAVVMAARSADQLEQVRREIEAAGGRAAVIPTDVGRDDDLTALIPRTVEQWGKLTILVNNAGMGIYGWIEHTSNETWDALMRINARAPFILCREAIGPMRAAGGGRIINIASVLAVKGYVNQAAYTASKHALIGFSKVLAQETAKDGIRVHTICPGGVDTDLAIRARPDLDRSILIRPQEIARIVLFLLSMRGNAVIDDVHVRRATAEPWF